MKNLATISAGFCPQVGQTGRNTGLAERDHELIAELNKAASRVRNSRGFLYLCLADFRAAVRQAAYHRCDGSAGTPPRQFLNAAGAYRIGACPNADEM